MKSQILGIVLAEIECAINVAVLTRATFLSEALVTN